MNKNIEGEIKCFLKEHAISSVLIHSDLLRGFNVEFDKKNRNRFISDHYQKLSELFNDARIYMPSFNYKFLSTKIFDVKNSPSEVGVLTEFFRKEIAAWRTKDPVFSFSGVGDSNFQNVIQEDVIIDPFGKGSFFKNLYDNDSLLFHYGSEFKHSTIIHFVERTLGAVPYRYDKLFRGNIIEGKMIFPVKYNYHVRPLSRYLDYDWGKITSNLTANGILYTYLNGRTQVCLCSIKNMVDFLNSKMKIDPFYLLDEKSKNWIIPEIQKIGRNFLLEDFE